MPALLTAAIIICGALREPGAPLACRAQVYHGIYAEQRACEEGSAIEARRLESAIVMDGRMKRTRSHSECFSAADEGDVAFYLPEYMRTRMGAVSTTVIHYDIMDGEAIERAPKVKQQPKIKGARI